MTRRILPPINEADGVLDELQAWFLVRAEAEGWVYTSVLRQLVNQEVALASQGGLDDRLANARGAQRALVEELSEPLKPLPHRRGRHRRLVAIRSH